MTAPPTSTANAITSVQAVEALDLRALLAILLGVALGSLDTAIANTALPAIAADLHAPPAASIWVINAYQLAVVASGASFWAAWPSSPRPRWPAPLPARCPR